MELQDLIVEQQQLREDLAKTLNKYGRLPACMIEPVLRDYCVQIENIQENQLKSAKQYIENREAQKKDNKEEENNEQD